MIVWFNFESPKKAMVQDLLTMMKKRVAMKGWLSRYMNKAKDVISKEVTE